MSISMVIGDPHIGRSTSIGRPGIGSALNSRIIDQFNILEWILSRAIEHMVENIILTGDIFDDAKPNSTLITLFVSWLKKCTDNNIDVHIIAGNHDILRSGKFVMSALDIISAADMEGIYVYKDINTIHTYGASFTFMPFRDRRSFNNDSNESAMKIMKNKMPYELSSIDLYSAKVVIGHLTIEGSIPVGDEIDDRMNELFCPLSMFKGYDYVWMGHIHKPQIISKSPFVAHIGSMDLSNFSESEHRKVVLIFNPKNSEPYKYIEIPTRPLTQISVSVPDTVMNTTEFVINELNKETKINKSIVRMNVSTDSSNTSNIDRQIIEKHLNDLGAFHICSLNEIKKIATVNKNATTDGINNTVNEHTAIKMFANSNINESMKDDFISLAIDIVNEYDESN